MTMKAKRRKESARALGREGIMHSGLKHRGIVFNRGPKFKQAF
jgi:hypothetical protein